MNIVECRKLLVNYLTEVISNDYILLDLPFFPNVGDVLIWQATIDVLSQLPYKCLYSSSIGTYIKPNINKNVVILFMGGGNYGDLWIDHQYFRHKVLKDFPCNPILQLPQSVCFQDKNFMQRDAEIMEKHKGKVSICLRDRRSYDIITSNYKNIEVKLLPDMVLSLDVRKFCKPKDGDGVLYVKREDIEQIDQRANTIPENAEIRDWPSMEKKPYFMRIYSVMMFVAIIFDRIAASSIHILLEEWFFKKIFRKLIVKSGIRFVNKYKVVYSTRLHVSVVAALLGKETYMFDNSYNKIKGVYELWMKDYTKVKMV